MNLSIKISVVESSAHGTDYSKAKWFELPVSRAVIADQINLVGQYDGFEIVDHDAPFLIDPFTPIEFLNHVATLFEENKGHPALGYAVELVKKYDVFSGFDEAIERLNDIIIHSEELSEEQKNKKNVFQMPDGVFVEVK